MLFSKALSILINICMFIILTLINPAFMFLASVTRVHLLMSTITALCERVVSRGYNGDETFLTSVARLILQATAKIPVPFVVVRCNIVYFDYLYTILLVFCISCTSVGACMDA